MKTVILIAGLCRPKTSICVKVIRAMKKSLYIHQIETVLVDDMAKIAQDIYKREHIDHCILMKKEPDTYIWKKFPKVKCYNARAEGASQVNMWRLREKIKLGLDYINAIIPDCSHVCLIRPCTFVELDCKQLKMDKYNVIINNIPGVTDDRFAFGPKHLINAVWNYKDRQELDSFDMVENNEGYTDKIVRFNYIDTYFVKPKKLVLRKEA